jgi:Na+-transporting methylmalonyl-CoA/oxaloacetate decarboxylase gamma subunit
MFSDASADRVKQAILRVAQALTVAAALMTIATLVRVVPLTLLLFMMVAQVFLLLSILITTVVLITSIEREVVQERFAPGAAIFRQGEAGDKVYVVNRGEVEVIQETPEGGAGLIARLGPGEHFGEMALIRRAPRMATVRAVTEVEVLAIKAGAFASLFAHLPALRETFQRSMEQRLQALAVQAAPRPAGGGGAPP